MTYQFTEPHMGNTGSKLGPGGVWVLVHGHALVSGSGGPRPWLSNLKPQAPQSYFVLIPKALHLGRPQSIADKSPCGGYNPLAIRHPAAGILSPLPRGRGLPADVHGWPGLGLGEEHSRFGVGVSHLVPEAVSVRAGSRKESRRPPRPSPPPCPWPSLARPLSLGWSFRRQEGHLSNFFQPQVQSHGESFQWLK